MPHQFKLGTNRRNYRENDANCQAQETITAHSINYGRGTIPFQLSYATRKSLEISVLPDKSVFIKAPTGTSIEAVENKVQQRARWIKKQIRYFEQFYPRTPERKYVGGETHLYLGKQYRLKIATSDTESICLKDGYFHIQCAIPQAKNTRRLLDRWYREKAATYLNKIYTACWERFHAQQGEKPELKLVRLTRRWGSLSKAGILSLNLDLIKAPKACIEYVIVHELCHLIHYNHSSQFYKLLEQTLPDWRKRKQKLEMALA